MLQHLFLFSLTIAFVRTSSVKYWTFPCTHNSGQALSSQPLLHTKHCKCHVISWQIQASYVIKLPRSMQNEQKDYVSTHIILWGRYEVLTLVNITMSLSPMLMTSSMVDRHHFTRSCHLQCQHGHTWRWSQHVPPKHWYKSVKLHGITSQKTAM